MWTIVHKVSKYIVYLCTANELQVAMELEKKFALTISRLRLTATEKITQQEIADEAGISLRYYCELEKGTKNPTLKTINAIAEVHGMKTWELLRLVENNE